MRTLKFGSLEREPAVRRVSDMKEVILDQGWASENPETELYYMYRDLWLDPHKEIILKNDLRYDITVIPPCLMGKEFVKTQGHHHPDCVPGLSYTELYEVLEGEAHFLLQRQRGGVVEDVVLIKARAGDKAPIPSNYGHVTINPGNSPLKLANWVSRRFSSIYEEYKLRKGGAYYELSDGSFLRNPNYDQVPELRIIEARELSELNIRKGKPIYDLIETPENLRFLNQPQEFKDLLARVIE